MWTQRINTRRHGARGDSTTTRALREIPIEQAFAFSPQFPPESTGLLEVTVSAEKALRGAWSTEHRLRRIGEWAERVLLGDPS